MSAATTYSAMDLTVPATRYLVTAQPLFRFLPDASVEVRTLTKTLRLPQFAFRALMEFAEPRTIAEVAAAMPEMSHDDLISLVSELEARDLVAPVRDAETPANDVDGARFEDLFRPGVFDDETTLAELARHLADGRALVIPDALRPDLAERIHTELQVCDKWQNIEEFDQISHFRFRSVDYDRHLPESTLHVRHLARAAGARRLMSRLSGRDCEGTPEFSCSYYRPGDFTHPHDDAQAHRSIAAVFNMSKNWDPKWGGSLFWAPNGSYITPRFNTLTLFNVATTGVHQVIPVSPLALEKRLTMNIWWTNSTPPPRRDKSHFAKSNANEVGITPHAYGRAPEVLAHRITAV